MEEIELYFINPFKIAILWEMEKKKINNDVF